jgi:4-diphosphocytidyl-2-C-methyl-D-erythritol kinase
MDESLTGPAHAKVNLVLEVLGKREDGYHEIDTILQEIELADVVTIERSADWSIAASGPRAAGVPVDETNLALKAAKLLAARVPGSFPVTINLEKHIPAAGGLGGGASDAATTLRLLQRMWAGASDEDLLGVANAIGSDEAFFLVGGTARAQGRGERVTSLPPIPPQEVVVFIPPETIERKTQRMFEALGRLPFDGGERTRDFVAEPPRSTVSPFNAFERVAFELVPSLRGLWMDLESRIEQKVSLAGAGPCLFWMGDYGPAEMVARAAQGADCEIIPTHTVSRE